MKFDEDFLQAGGLAAYIQAAAAVLALVLAFFAYGSWRTEEYGKRKADTALEMLKDVYAASECLKRARMGFGVYEGKDVEEEILNSIARDGPKQLKECNAFEAKLHGHSVVAPKLFGSDVDIPLSSILSKYRQVNSAHHGVGTFKEVLLGREPGDPNFRQMLIEEAKVAGMFVISRDAAKARDDPFEVELDKAVQRIDEALSDEVAFK